MAARTPEARDPVEKLMLQRLLGRQKLETQ